jgi:type I restriction enzyme, R subunit
VTESGYVEAAFIEWLAGKASDPNDHGLGWTYRSADDMEAFARADADPLVETLLVKALIAINHHNGLTTETQARQAAEVLRRAMSNPDLLEANRKTLELLRDGVPMVLTPGQPPVTVLFIEFDPQKEDLNDLTVTRQYTVRGSAGVRPDTVLLVNGIPLVVCEFKNYATSGDWKEGHRQLHRYQREAPLLLTPSVFCVASDDQEFRFGTVLFDAEMTSTDIDKQRDHWQPWLSQYPVREGYWNLPEHEQDFDKVRASVTGLLRPCNVLDFLQHFLVFEMKRGRTIKKVARYQQFEAANQIVDRVVEKHGRAVARQERTGLVWHTQGSGKSLTMIYAGYKLRRHPRLANPTVLIVVDRSDLKKQLSDDFLDCDYPSVSKALGVRDLKAKIGNDARETVVTTVQCFQQMEDLVPNERDGIICLIDEAHRSQKGKGAGYAMTMRAKLPNAFRFGFTGTPIDRTLTNTHRDFGPVADGQQERYLSRYGIKQAIKDGATLPVYFEFRKVPLAVDETGASQSFEAMCDEMEIDDEDEKEFHQRREARWKALATHPDRVAKVIGHAVKHFLEHPDPNGFKAQLVAIDRAACVQYKDALDAEFRRLGIPEASAWSDVVISASQNDPPALERYHYTKEQTEAIIERFKLTPAKWKADSLKKFGDDCAKWQPLLKILIVCDRLLTGFDAPIEQVMYLDKPLRDHNLLQAMARTNRPLVEMGKMNGVIIDYFGVLEDMQRALNFKEDELEEAVIDWEKLKALMPGEIALCMEFFEGIKIADTRDCLMAALRALVDPDTAKAFETQFKRTETLWEALSPDESLYPHRFLYGWLCGIYIAHRRRNRRVIATSEELAIKTREVIQQHTTFFKIVEDVPVYKIDANYLTKVRDLPTPADKAAELEAALTRELTEKSGHAYAQLGERLKRMKYARDATDAASIGWLTQLEDMVKQVSDLKQEPTRLGLTEPGEYALFAVIRTFAVTKDEPLCVQAAKHMISVLRKKGLLPTGWSSHKAGRQPVNMTLQVESWEPQFEPLGLSPPEQQDDASAFLRAAVDELGRELDNG